MAPAVGRQRSITDRAALTAVTTPTWPAPSLTQVYSRCVGLSVQRLAVHKGCGVLLKTKGSTMSAKITLRHTVTCYGCGAQVTDLTRTKTAIRNELRGQGWAVAIPMWLAGLGTRSDPAIARKPVDYCPSCVWKQKVEAMQNLEEYNRWQGKVRTSDRLQ